MSWIFPKRLWGFSHSDQTVYLTFDDGPDPEITEWVLDYLKKEGLVATFFCVGENVRTNPGLFGRILDEGHQVGNHTMRHENGFKVNKKKYLESVEQAGKWIDSSLFRPPYGRLPRSLDTQLIKQYKIVMWSWLSFDYDRSVDPQKIIAKANNIKAGDILVFHDNKKTKDRLKAILPPIIDGLKKRGLKFGLIN